jgi:hypothetical protein
MRRLRVTDVIAIVVFCVAAQSLAAGRAESVGVEPVVSATAVPLLDVPAAVTSLAVSANGQTVYFIDAAKGSIGAVDPFDPRRRRDVVSPPAADQGRAVAIGCLPGDVLAAVWRNGDAWELRTHRLRPGEAADPARPEARVSLGNAGGAGDHVAVVVSRSRDWLAITALPPPLPPVVRGVFAGAGVRLLPPAEAASDGARPVAATVSPADELVLFEAVGDGESRIVFMTPAGRPLLRVRSGLSDVRAAAFSRRDGRLWASAGPAGGRAAGLWRLDAVVTGGEQTVRPAAVPGPMAPRTVIDVPGEALVVAETGPRPTVTRIDLDEKEMP